MRIGLFGGTFNPIHLGHIQVVHEVQEGFALERIILIPSALPPHKEPGGVADARDRMEMIRLAIADYQNFTVSDVELKRSGPSYTIDTVRHFKAALPEDYALYLILGLDAFLEIDTWKSYTDLFLMVPFIVMARTDAGDSDTVLRWQTLEAYLKSRITEGYQFSASRFRRGAVARGQTEAVLGQREVARLGRASFVRSRAGFSGDLSAAVAARGRKRRSHRGARPFSVPRTGLHASMRLGASPSVSFTDWPRRRMESRVHVPHASPGIAP